MHFRYMLLILIQVINQNSNAFKFLDFILELASFWIRIVLSKNALKQRLAAAALAKFDEVKLRFKFQVIEFT